VEVFVSTPLEVCELRDPKGLYVRARAGDVKVFTGVTADYEPPVSSDLVIDTSKDSQDECAELIFKYLSRRTARAPLGSELFATPSRQ
jgi:adenylylsulfate kinase